MNDLSIPSKLSEVKLRYIYLDCKPFQNFNNNLILIEEIFIPRLQGVRIYSLLVFILLKFFLFIQYHKDFYRDKILINIQYTPARNPINTAMVMCCIF
jgi:hypothetical protein